MSAPASLWRFAPHVDAERANRMYSFTCFEDVVERFVAKMPARFVWEKPRDTYLAGCERVSFLFEVPEETYDAFFNAPVGYRAQYAQGTDVGLAANRHFLDAMWARLFGSAWIKGEANLERIEASLGGYDAKAWILESEVSEQIGRNAEDILYDPWKQKSESGAGLLAPVGTTIEIIGAWIDESGHERRNPRKANRSLEIHETGYT